MTICDKSDYCDGYPEKCSECSNQQSPRYTVNNVNIQVSGGSVVNALLLSVVIALLTPSFNYGSGKVHNITGAILPDRDTVYYVTEVDKTS